MSVVADDISLITCGLYGGILEPLHGRGKVHPAWSLGQSRANVQRQSLTHSHIHA